MRVAVWDIRLCSFLFGSPPSDEVEVLFREPDECKSLLDSGEVDAALLPAVDVLADVERYRVLPQAVLASLASFPYATIAVHGGLDGIRSAEGFARSRSTATVGEIVLRESYGLETAVKYRRQSSTNGSAPDAYLTFGDPPDDSDPDTAVFDVGREWFELTTRPFAWGLFAVASESKSDDIGEWIGEVVTTSLSDENRELWISSESALSEVEKSFITHDLRTSFDEEILAGLDEFMRYLFYFGKIDDICTLQFSQPPQSMRQSE